MTDEKFTDPEDYDTVSNTAIVALGHDVATRQFNSIMEILTVSALRAGVPEAETPERLAEYVSAIIKGMALGAHMSIHQQERAYLLTAVLAFGDTDTDAPDLDAQMSAAYNEAHASAHNIWDRMISVVRDDADVLRDLVEANRMIEARKAMENTAQERPDA